MGYSPRGSKSQTQLRDFHFHFSLKMKKDASLEIGLKSMLISSERLGMLRHAPEKCHRQVLEAG